MSLNDQQKNVLIIALLLICIIGIIYLSYKSNISEYVSYVINEQTNPVVFIILFIFLPIIGFPIVLFLILLGVKFGIKTGTLIMFLCLPIHMVSSFLLANHFLKPPIENLVKKRGYRFPQMSESRLIWFSIVFMIVPGLSYTMKNFIFALSGISFGYYFLIGCIVNGIMGIPFIIAGDAAAGKSFLILAIVVLFLVVAYGFNLKIKRRYRTNV